MRAAGAKQEKQMPRNSNKKLKVKAAKSAARVAAKKAPAKAKKARGR